MRLLKLKTCICLSTAQLSLSLQQLPAGAGNYLHIYKYLLLAKTTSPSTASL